MVVDTNYSWQPIETAPDSERVMVCGVQPQSPGGTIAYWWYEEDVTFDGKPTEKPHALFWAPIILPPFPYPAAHRTPKTEGEG